MRKLPFLFLTLLLPALASARAETLPLPGNLTPLDSAVGEDLFMGAEARASFFPLSMYFVTQETPSFCGVASMAMVLNALKIPGPASMATDGIAFFDQDNVLDAKTEAIRAKADIMQRGMTLDQLGLLLQSRGARVEVHHAGDGSLAEFRKLAWAQIGRKDAFVLVNYLRSAIGQQSYGHISPLAAYDADSDQFLILDVARYKYPPVWVSAAELFAAMNTPDSDNGNRTRGFVLVGR
jgi:hypothetical protein